MGIIYFCFYLLVVYLTITVKIIEFIFYYSLKVEGTTGPWDWVHLAPSIFKRICVSLILSHLLRPTFNPNYYLNNIPHHLVKYRFGSKQGTTKRYYSTSPPTKTIVERKDNPQFELNPFWLTGFADGEACFYVGVKKSKKVSIGWRITLSFTINLHVIDRAVLELIRNYLGVGRIYQQDKGFVQLRIESIKEIEAVISYFQKYPLITEKLADFVLFMEVYNIIINKEHLTETGLRKIVARKASMNNGLSLALTSAFADVTPVNRPLVLDKKIKDPNWLAGFIAVESCFFINITNLANNVSLTFKITQHERDKELIVSFIDYLGCGNVYKNGEIFDYRVSKLSDIEDKIIPFLKNYPLKGVKSLDFDDWHLVARIMKEKKHLTPEGLEQIKQIKARMNTQRKESELTD